MTRAIALLALALPTTAFGSTIRNAGDFEFTLGLSLGDIASMGEVEFSGQITGSIDEDGMISIPQAGFALDPMPMTTSMLGEIVITPTAAGDWSGSLEPETGALVLEGSFSFGVAGVGFPMGFRCSMAPVVMRLASGSSGDFEGEAYDPESGHGVLVDAEYEVPESRGCFDTIELTFDETVGLPAPANTSWIAMEYDMLDSEGTPLRSEDWYDVGGLEPFDVSDPGWWPMDDATRDTAGIDTGPEPFDSAPPTDTGAPPDGHEAGAGGGGGDVTLDTGPPPYGHEDGAGDGTDTSDPGFDPGPPPHGDEDGAGDGGDGGGSPGGGGGGGFPGGFPG